MVLSKEINSKFSSPLDCQVLQKISSIGMQTSLYYEERICLSIVLVSTGVVGLYRSFITTSTDSEITAP